MVAIFRSLEGESLEDYAIRLADAWRVGQKGLDNGVIFLVFVEDRRMRLEVGYGLEAALTDAVSSSILRDVVRPRFREGRLAEGIGAGLDAIDRAIAGMYRAPAAAARPAGPSGVQLALLLFVIGVLAAIILPALVMSSATRHARRGGVTGGHAGWGGPMVTGGGWSGGVGGSGGGGFSAGGGGFGGGGASGSW